MSLKMIAKTLGLMGLEKEPVADDAPALLPPKTAVKQAKHEETRRDKAKARFQEQSSQWRTLDKRDTGLTQRRETLTNSDQAWGLETNGRLAGRKR